MAVLLPHGINLLTIEKWNKKDRWWGEEEADIEGQVVSAIWKDTY